MVFNATFNNISVIGKFYWWWKLGKTNDLLQVADNLYQKMYQVQLAWTGIELTTSMVIGTDYIGKHC